MTWRSVGLALLFALQSCSSPAGRPCRVRNECGDGFLCDFPNGHACQWEGRCRTVDEVALNGVTCTDPSDVSLTTCGCDDATQHTEPGCTNTPAFFQFAGCERACDDIVLGQAVHPGPRLASEYCEGGIVIATMVPVRPARCCDCSLATEGPDGCFNASTGDRLPDGCCTCFAADAPDPTGRCTPPGGVLPSGASRWCCPIVATDDDGGGLIDGGG